jgi:hypothetical protein
VVFLRFLGAFLALWLLGLGVAYLVTRNRRYLRIAWLTVQVGVLIAVALMLLYLFERVLLVL